MPNLSRHLVSSKLCKYNGFSLTDSAAYKHVVEALQYCFLTSLEISFLVNQLCQQLHNSTSTHWFAANCVLRYLKGSVDHRLFYSKWSLHLHLVILIGLEIPMTGALPLTLLFFSVYEVLRSRLLFLVQAWRLNIYPWPVRSLNFVGYKYHSIKLQSHSNML